MHMQRDNVMCNKCVITQGVILCCTKMCSSDIKVSRKLKSAEFISTANVQASQNIRPNYSCYMVCIY